MKSPWERGCPARTRPGTASAIFPHCDQPGTAPWLSVGLAVAVPAGLVAGCSIAGKLSDGQRHKDGGETPALPGVTPPLRGSRAARRRLMRWGGEPTPDAPPPAQPYRRWGSTLSSVCRVSELSLSPHRLDYGLRPCLADCPSRGK